MSSSGKSEPVRPRGRPRSFNCDLALAQALQVFWRKGYAGASLSDLTKAMGVNRPSLYAAYGDKESLFRKALDLYMRDQQFHIQKALDQPNARAVAEALLVTAADSMCGGARHPAGCLLVQGGLAAGEEDESIRRELITRRRANEFLIRRRMRRAKQEGDLPARSDPDALARYLATVSQGMAVQAASGVTREQLRQVAETALQAWPS